MFLSGLARCPMCMRMRMCVCVNTFFFLVILFIIPYVRCFVCLFLLLIYCSLHSFLFRCDRSSMILCVCMFIFLLDSVFFIMARHVYFVCVGFCCCYCRCRFATLNANEASEIEYNLKRVTSMKYKRPVE